MQSLHTRMLQFLLYHISCFAFKDDSDLEQRKDALFMDIILLGKCQEVWVFGSQMTEGMKREIEIAEKRKQVIKCFTSEGLGVKTNAKF